MKRFTSYNSDMYGKNGKKFLVKIVFAKYYGRPNKPEVITAVWNSIAEELYETTSGLPIDENDIYAYEEVT